MSKDAAYFVPILNPKTGYNWSFSLHFMVFDRNTGIFNQYIFIFQYHLVDKTSKFNN